ncbi:MAG: TonB-dependent receptor, partial [Pseudomonadota bacterium]|nr:TonB-dependent receptor [Pseudomonadota bacterium]
YEKINFIQLGSNKDYGDPDQRQYQEDKALGFEYIQPYKYFQIEASVRKNFSQRFKNNDAYRLGLSIPIKNGKIFINKSLSIKNPTFTERFGYYAGTFYGNNNLVPEESKQYELGIQKIINNFNIKGSLYFSRLYNEINGFTYDSDLGGYTAKNKSSKSYRRGLDAAVTYLFNSSDKISLNYSYVSATEFDSNINKQVREIRRPRNIFTVNYVNKYYDGLLYTNTQLYYSSKIIDKDFSQYPARNVKIKDHFILNFNSDIKLSKNYTVSLYLKNITNKKYQETYGYKMPGFEAYINLNTNF